MQYSELQTQFGRVILTRVFIGAEVDEMQLFKRWRELTKTYEEGGNKVEFTNGFEEMRVMITMRARAVAQ